MLLRKRRIASIFMTVVMIITAVNFCPFYRAKAAEPEEQMQYSVGADAEEMEGAAEQENETAASDNMDNELFEETTGTSETEATTETATEEEIVTEAATEEQEMEPELIYEEVPDAGENADIPESETVALDAGATATVTGRQDVSYGPSYGHSYIVNDGSVGYSAYCCAKDNNNTPGIGSSGTVTDITDWGNGPTYRRIFYFGCLPAYSFDSEAHRILAVSQTLSAYYSGTSNTFAAFDNATKDFTVPSASVSVTAPASQATIEGNLQKTGTYTISADGHTSVSITIPDGVTLYSGENAYTGTTSLGNGAQFYLTAPLDTTGTFTGTVTGSQTVSRVYLLDFGSPTQPLMFADWITPQASYSVTFATPRGSLEIKKVSADPSVTNGNPCYSLKGAVYTLYKNTADANANRNVITTLTTDEDGYARADNLELGNYIFKETKNPPGYALDTRLYSITITADHTAQAPFKVDIQDMPQMDPTRVMLTKQDDKGTRLAGAEYTFKFYDVQMNTNPANEGKTPLRTWVFRTNANGVIQLSNTYKVLGDDFYYGLAGEPQLPLGTLTIQETKAPEGYLLDNKVHVRQITSSGTAEAVSTYNAPTVIEHQIRGDLAFIKKDAESGEPIGSVKFSVTDEAGESHIIWTDENGYYSTASDYIPHSSNTNSDKLGAGIWFGSKAVDDTLGALPYGTYTIKELRCEANKNKYKDLAAFTVDVTEHGTVVDYGDVTNERFPVIRTEAWDTMTGTNLAAYSDTIHVTDTCYLDNLDIGHTYTIRGKVMLPDAGEELIQAGKTVTAETTFTATAEVMKIDVNGFVIDTNGLAGRDIVLFEYLYDNAYPNEVVATDEDLYNLSQTIHFPEIRTMAEDSITGAHEAFAGKETTITDTVSYTNLMPGKEYVLTGTIIDKETGEPLEIDGDTVTASRTFTPEQASGTEEISFTFDASGLAGKDIVVFEDLCYGDKLIAVHAEIEDVGQTIHFPAIKTTAEDSITGAHEAFAGKETTITDTISYTNLMPGKEYVLTGTIIDKETGEPLEIDGDTVAASRTFTPEQASGTEEISFTFDASGLAGRDIVVFEDLCHGDKLIAVHADIEDAGQTIHFPAIKTTAEDSITGTHEAFAGKETTITDTVSYTNLMPGKEYVLTGTIIDKETGEPLEIDGDTVTASRTFAPEQASGTEEISFTFDASGLAGKDIVVFEDLCHGDKLIAVHADIEDAGQTIHFPAIKTAAEDSVSGTHEARRSTSTTIIDTVAYKNLTAGKKYHVEGIVYDYETGEPLEVDGNTVTAELDFVPEAEGGTIDMEYTFQSLWLHGKRVVVFEYLYADDMMIALHADIEDEGQSVTFDNYVGRLVLDTRSGPASGGWHRSSPRTGDMTRPYTMFLIMCAAGICGAILLVTNRKKRKYKGIKKVMCTVLPFVAGMVGMCTQFSARAEEAYDYVATETDVYKTRDETAYDFGFEQTIEISGVTYNLDHVEYDAVNRYAEKFGSDAPAYEITRERSGITEDERENFKPSVASIKGEYTYEYDSVKFKTEGTHSIEMTSYLDTDVVTGDFNPAEYPQTVLYTYEDEKEYTLPYSGYEKLEEGWYDGYMLSGRIEYYDAPTYMLGQNELTEDILAGVDQESLNRIMEDLGYAGMYRAVNAYFDGEAYMENGIMYRNYCIEGAAYGAKYRLIYGETAELPLYTAVMTYTMSEAEQQSIEALKESYEVTAYAYYMKAEQKEQQGLSMPEKIALGSGIVLLILLLAALMLYLAKGGRKPTDYKSKRDVRRDYKNL